MDYKGEWGRGPWTLRGGGDFESEDKYAVCFLDFFDKTIIIKTVEKHLFFLIQSILLFHDRCCFTFFSARPIYVRLQ